MKDEDPVLHVFATLSIRPTYWPLWILLLLMCGEQTHSDALAVTVTVTVTVAADLISSLAIRLALVPFIIGGGEGDGDWTISIPMPIEVEVAPIASFDMVKLGGRPFMPVSCTTFAT